MGGEGSDGGLVSWVGGEGSDGGLVSWVGGTAGGPSRGAAGVVCRWAEMIRGWDTSFCGCEKR